MKPYEIIPHPAELRIRVFGKTKEELFQNAAAAMADILSPTTKFETKNQNAKIKIKVKSVDINTLLVDFLNEVLARSQINKCIYKVSELITQNLLLIATLVGYPVDHFDEDIKAVTYQDVNIESKNGLWQTMIVFDI